MNERGKLIVLSGPSGVGKTTICNRILNIRSDVRYSISATSRPMREGETNGKEYIFLTVQEFNEWIEKDLFAEYAWVHGNLYGTPRRYLEENLSKGYHVIMDVDVKGAKTLMELYPDSLYFFVIPPDLVELERRLLKRNTDENEVIKHRLAEALEELKFKGDYKHIVENRELQQTVEGILSIIGKELDAQSDCDLPED